MHPFNRDRSGIRHHFNMRALQRAMVTAGVVAAVPVSAQQAGAQDEPQTVIITATKRAEKQREVAGSVAVLQGSDLERHGAVDQEDAFKLVPGVQLAKGETSYNNVVIRGLATNGCTVCQGDLQNPTGLYLEDVPLTDPLGKLMVPDILPFDLERVEILRGPQGALYGSASLSGAVRYLFAKPDLRAFGATAQAGVSTVAHGGTGYSLYGMLNAPLSENVVGIRAVAYDRKEGGYIDDVGIGKKDSNEVRQRGGRLLVSAKPLKALTGTLVIMSERTNQDDGNSITEGKGIVPDVSQYRRNGSAPTTQSTQFDFMSLAVAYDLGDHTLTSTTGWWKKLRLLSWDLTPLYSSLAFAQTIPIGVAVANRRAGATARSEEFRISSNAGGSLSYVAGVFLQEVKSDPGGYARTVATQASFLDTESTYNKNASEKAAFFDGEYAFGGGWSAGLGARFYRISSHTDGITDGVADPATHSSESGNTPKASIKYRWDNNLWYALTSKGYRFGGQNGAPTFLPYSSDSLWNYETGVRLSPTKGLQVDLTAFLLKWDNAQFSYLDTSTINPTVVIGNVGQARSMGLEALARYRISTDIDVASAVAYTDSKTTKDVNGTNGLIPSGSRLPNTAKWQTALQANYRFEGPYGWGGRFNVTHTYTGDRVLDIDAQYKVGGYGSLDLGLGFVRENVSVAINLVNAADGHGILSNIGGGPPPNLKYYEYFIQKPRTLNVSLRYDY